MHSAPKQFLFIAVLANANGPRLAKHLNDYMFISHFHNPEDGFPNLEDLYDDRNSISSVVKKSLTAHPNAPPRISASVCTSVLLFPGNLLILSPRISTVCPS